MSEAAWAKLRLAGCVYSILMFSIAFNAVQIVARSVRATPRSAHNASALLLAGRAGRSVAAAAAACAACLPFAANFFWPECTGTRPRPRDRRCRPLDWIGLRRVRLKLTGAYHNSVGVAFVFWLECVRSTQPLP